MRKFLITVTALLLALSVVPARADGFTAWTLETIESGYAADFDGDGDTETFILNPQLDEWGCGSIVLSVGDASITQEYVDNMAEDVFILPVGMTGYAWSGDYIYGTLFMISEYGPSDDPFTYFYLYTDGTLIEAGGIPSMPTNMDVGRDGIISTWVRADMIGTWSRPADYMLARGYSWSDDSFSTYYHLCEIPEGYGAFGMIVSLKRDINLFASPTDAAPSVTLSAAEYPRVILAATDDVRWIHVTSFNGDRRGWVRMGREDYETVLYLNGGTVNINDVFGDILYAD